MFNQFEEPAPSNPDFISSYNKVCEELGAFIFEPQLISQIAAHIELAYLQETEDYLLTKVAIDHHGGPDDLDLQSSAIVPYIEKEVIRLLASEQFTATIEKIEKIFNKVNIPKQEVSQEEHQSYLAEAKKFVRVSLFNCLSKVLINDRKTPEEILIPYYEFLLAGKELSKEETSEFNGDEFAKSAADCIKQIQEMRMNYAKKICLDRINELVAAAGNGNIEEVQRLLPITNVNEYNSEGITALNKAAQNGHLQIVMFLLENGAILDLANAPNASEKTLQGKNAIYLAALYGHSQVLYHLLHAYSVANLELDITLYTDLSDEISAFEAEINEKTMRAKNIDHCIKLTSRKEDTKKQLKRNRLDDLAGSLEQNNPHPGKIQKKTAEADSKSSTFATSSSSSSFSSSPVPADVSTSSWSAVSSSSSSSALNAMPLAYSYSALASASASTAITSAAASPSSSSSSFSALACANGSRKPSERQPRKRSTLQTSEPSRTAEPLDIAKIKREIGLVTHESFKEEFHKQIADSELNLEIVREKAKLLLLDLPAQLASYGKPLNGEDSTRINQLFTNYFLKEKDRSRNKHASTGQATSSGLKKS